MKDSACLVFIVIIFLLSCEYDPDGKYFKAVSEKGPVTISAKIDDKDSLISIWESSNLNYDISPNTIKVEKMDVFLNDQFCGSYSSNTGSMTIDPYQLSDGNYPLRLEMYMRAGSGSLADNIGAELYLWKKEFILNVDRSISQSSKITGVKPESGKLRIDWVKYPKENFEKYILDDVNIGGAIEINNIDQTYYYDGSFVGGNCDYFLRVYAAGKSTENQLYRFTLPYSHLLEITAEANYSSTLKWSKCLFYSNFSEYKVSLIGYSGDIELFSSNDINDTVANISNFPFGERILFFITTQSKNQDIRIISTERAVVGDSSFQYLDNMVACPYPGDEIYFSDGNLLYRYSSEDFSIVQKLPYGYYNNRFTANKKYLLTQYMNNGNLMLYSVPQFEEIGSLSFKHLLVDYAISENGKAVILTQDSLMLYDYFLKQKESMPILHTNFSQFRTYISSNGTCIYVDDPIRNDKIYQLDNNQVFKTASLADSKFYGFNPFDENEFIVYKNNRLVFYDSKTISIVRSIDIPAFPASNIDPVSGYFITEETKLTERYSTFGIYDIKTGRKVGQLTATTTPQSQYGSSLTYLFCNKIIYSPYGYKLKTIE